MDLPSGIHSFRGNLNLLKEHKTTFLCSRRIASQAVLPCFDWAIQMRNSKRCVISGFHSTLEKDVLHYLLKGQQPVIMVLARSMKKDWDDAILSALERQRLLILSPFGSNTSRSSSASAMIRNKIMLQMADEIVIGYATPGGAIEQQLLTVASEKITYLSR
jgi:predicted Rossmann fold nucleotide-binding protein DprA/Smf involved in DNA uptake